MLLYSIISTSYSISYASSIYQQIHYKNISRILGLRTVYYYSVIIELQEKSHFPFVAISSRLFFVTNLLDYNEKRYFCNAWVLPFFSKLGPG